MEDPIVPRPSTASAPSGMPRWVKAAALVTAVLLAAIVLMVVLGEGEHGPGRHTGGSGNHGRAAVRWTAP